MSEFPFQAFIELIDFDQEILKNEKAIQALRQEIQELSNEEKKLDDQYASIKNNAVQARKSVDRIELEMKSLESAEKDKKNRLENSTDYKQYQSIKQEIENVHRKQNDNEVLLMEAWNTLETTQKELDQLTKQMAQKKQELSASITDKNKTIGDLDELAQQKNQQRIEKEKKIPQEWLEKYAMMRSRVSDPVVPVLRGACSSCFYSLSEQDLLRVRHRALLQCKGCFRLLYSPEHSAEKS